MANYTVYMHINKVNGKKYIGQTKQKVKNRWRNGLGYRTQVFFYAINKYGWDGFEHIIVETNLSKDEADNLEKKLILKYDTRNSQYGYNITSGGEGTIGVISVWRGKHLPESTRKKISESNMNKIVTDESRHNMSLAQKKLAKSESYINPMQNKHHSDEAKKKQSEAFYRNPNRKANLDKIRKIKSVNQYDKQGNYICNYESITLASNITDISIDSIQGCCSGRYKTGGGFVWKYAESEVA